MKVKEHLDAMDTPERRTQKAVKTRFILELRRLARANGWDIRKIIWQHINLALRPISFKRCDDFKMVIFEKSNLLSAII